MNNINLNKTDSFKKTHTKSNKNLTDVFKKYLNRVNSNIDRDVKNFSARIKSFFNSILKSNTSKYTTYTQQTPVYTQYTQYMYSHPTPTISYEKMRYNQLKSSDVLISDLKAHPEDFNLVKSDIKKTLEMRGFESRAAENIT
ncbi:MAG: hypothetical protein OXD32_06585, partial [Endozoicomonadaceae bacterium]|nr:hypothetical protein [Endozoicomonadaceae bacterium]